MRSRAPNPALQVSYLSNEARPKNYTLNANAVIDRLRKLRPEAKFKVPRRMCQVGVPSHWTPAVAASMALISAPRSLPSVPALANFEVPLQEGACLGPWHK